MENRRKFLKTVIAGAAGGAGLLSAEGEVLAQANRAGREEILHGNLEILVKTP